MTGKAKTPAAHCSCRCPAGREWQIEIRGCGAWGDCHSLHLHVDLQPGVHLCPIIWQQNLSGCWSTKLNSIPTAGLPEQWSQEGGGGGFENGAFSLQGQFPRVEENIHLIKGLFSDSIPPFLQLQVCREMDNPKPNPKLKKYTRSRLAACSSSAALKLRSSHRQAGSPSLCEPAWRFALRAAVLAQDLADGGAELRTPKMPCPAPRCPRSPSSCKFCCTAQLAAG